MTSSLCLLSLVFICSLQVILAQEFSWGASDYYMGWSGGYSWNQSRDKCKARGSGWDLAAIGTSTENTALEKILLDYCEAEQGDLALCCFLIGGYKINSPSDMQWTTGESASYFNWSEYYEEPNDLSRNPEIVLDTIVEAGPGEVVRLFVILGPVEV